MPIMRILITALLLASALTAAAADVRLRLDESTILPGTTTGITVTVANTARHATAVPSKLWLIAAGPSGERFRLNALTSSQPEKQVPSAMLRARESRDLRFDPVIGMVSSPWLLDRRLSTPGTYRVQAVLSPHVNPDGSFEPETSIVSAEEQLVVAVETAEDQAVWAWMNDRAPDGWGMWEWDIHRTAFTRFVLDEHPASNYALFAAVYEQRREDGPPARVLEEQAARPSDRTYAEVVRLLVGEYYVQTAQIAYKTDPLRAADAADVARDILAALVTSSRSIHLRDRARELLDQLPRREHYFRHRRER
jgi:hypothetical protein